MRSKAVLVSLLVWEISSTRSLERRNVVHGFRRCAMVLLAGRLGRLKTECCFGYFCLYSEAEVHRPSDGERHGTCTRGARESVCQV